MRILFALLVLSVSAEILHKPAPGFNLPDSKGASVKLSDYKGKVVLLDFWATWCGGCKVEIPWFMEFADRYKDKGFAVIGVSMDEEGWTIVKPFIQAKKLNYPIVIGTEEMAKQYGGVDALPETFLIDRDGNIASTHTGLVEKAAVEAEIQKLLQTGSKKAAK
jgi:peroxiredoxin